MKKFIITEEEKNRILGMHEDHGYNSLNEQTNSVLDQIKKIHSDATESKISGQPAALVKYPNSDVYYFISLGGASGINQQRYVVKSISHSFDQGLNTKLLLNMLSSGIAYGISNAATTIVISPSIESLEASKSQQFTAIVYDQFGNPLSSQPAITWSTNYGSISSNGLYEAPDTISSIEVKATANSVSGSTEFNITKPMFLVYFDEQGGVSVPDTTYYVGSTINLPTTTKSGYRFSGWAQTPQIVYSPTSIVHPGDILESPYMPQKTIGWSTGSLPIGGDQVVYGNNKFVALSGGTQAAYSTDGLTWTQITVPSGSAAVTYGNGKFVTVNAYGRYGGATSNYSTDGITWSSTALPSSNLNLIAAGNGKFIAGYWFTNQGAYSTDGITWTSQSFPKSMKMLMFANNKFLGLAYEGSNSYMISSTDGLTWTENILPVNPAYIEYGSGKYLVLGTAGAAYSTDGITWTIANFSPYGGQGTNENEIYGDIFFTSISRGSNVKSIQYSINALDWLHSYTGSYYFDGYRSVAYGNNRFVVTNYSYNNQGSVLIGTPTYDQTLYARWVLPNITYNANGGTGTVPIQDPDLQYTILSPNDYTDTYPDIYTLHKDGYTFVGWNTAANGSGTIYIPGDSITTLANDITLYAQWEVSMSIQSSLIDYEDTVNVYGSPEYPIDMSIPQVLPYGIYENGSYLSPNGYVYPTILWSSEQSHSNTHSLKIDWNESYNGGLMADTAEIPDVSNNQSQIIEKIVASAWVYVPSGSPDVMLICGYDGQLGNREYEQNNQYVSTSVKDQWVHLVLEAKNYQIVDLTDYQQTAIQIQPVYPNGTGIVYVDDLSLIHI